VATALPGRAPSLKHSSATSAAAVLSASLSGPQHVQQGLDQGGQDSCSGE
jgi:hypothetical protein